MIIDSVKKYKGTTYEVVIDGNRIWLHKDIVADYGLAYKKEISEEKYTDMLLASDRRRAVERGMYLLDYRDYSYKELFKKLSENYDEEICYYAVDKLVSLGIINDRRYAENLARKYIEVKKYGFYRASNEMYRKGIDRELVDEILEVYRDSTSDRICELINKKYHDCLDDRDKLRKMKNALVRQGYSFDEINTAVRMLECADDDEYQ
ncbi:MAG: regulatory protein RecX [Oscillospiraceae bacterium]|nr:regulatory protein RecX [Oscillospiraceae bacterium]